MHRWNVSSSESPLQKVFNHAKNLFFSLANAIHQTKLLKIKFKIGFSRVYCVKLFFQLLFSGFGMRGYHVIHGFVYIMLQHFDAAFKLFHLVTAEFYFICSVGIQLPPAALDDVRGVNRKGVYALFNDKPPRNFL